MGKPQHFWWLDLCRFYSEHQSFANCKQAAKIIRKMSGDHTSPNPFLDSTYGHGYPVQFPLQGDVRAFRQTGHATERNNYGAVEHRAYYLDNQLRRPRTLDSLQQQLAWSRYSGVVDQNNRKDSLGPLFRCESRLLLRLPGEFYIHLETVQWLLSCHGGSLAIW